MKTLLLVAAVAMSTHSSMYWSIAEQQINGGDIDSSGKKGIVDINGTLRIAIDTARIRALSQPMKSDNGRLRMVAGLLRKQGEMFKLLEDGSGSFTDRTARVAKVSHYYWELLGFAGTIPELSIEINSIFEQDPTPESYRKATAAIGRYIEDISRELGQDAENSRITLRLGGWLQDKSGASRPIHIQGFDNYQQGTFYEAPFLIVPTSEEFRQQLIEAKKICDDNIITMGSGLDRITAYADSLCATATSVLNCIGMRVNEIGAQAATPSVETVKSVRSRCGFLVARFSILAQSLRSASKNPLAGGPAALADAVQTFRIAKDTLSIVAADLKSLVSTRPGISALPDSIKTAIIACTTGTGVFMADLKVWDSTATSWLSLSGNGKIGVITAAFGEQVSRLLLENAPSAVDLDLRTLGHRNPGDRLVLRLECEQGNHRTSTSDKSAPLLSEQRSATLSRVNWYGRLTIGPAFVAPINPDPDRVKFTKDFQPAVSYSLLLKKGSRRLREPVASFLLPGFGVNVTSPDFNLDGVPEFGVGTVISWANDIVQGGAGRNIGADTWYAFFVLRLPFSIISGPGSEVSVRE